MKTGIAFTTLALLAVPLPALAQSGMDRDAPGFLLWCGAVFAQAATGATPMTDPEAYRAHGEALRQEGLDMLAASGVGESLRDQQAVMQSLVVQSRFRDPESRAETIGECTEGFPLAVGQIQEFQPPLPAAELSTPRIAPPQSAHAMGMARDTLERLWCGELFLAEQLRLFAQSDIEGAERAYERGAMVQDEAGRQLDAEGVNVLRRLALGDAYRAAVADLLASMPEDFSRGIAACEARFFPDAAVRGPVTVLDGHAARSAGDDALTVAIWTALAEAGDPDAAFFLAELHDVGWAGLERNQPRPVALYVQAAKAGHMHGQYMAGFSYRYGRGVAEDEAEAIRWYALAAEQGHARARYALGIATIAGIGGLRSAPEVGLGWLTLAAEQGGALALEALAHLNLPLPGSASAFEAATAAYEAGEYVRAAALFEPLAEGGHMQAQYQLGIILFSGLDIEKDVPRASHWFETAASQGHGSARAYLVSAQLQLAGR